MTKPSAEKTARKENRLASITAIPCTAANVRKKRNLFCVAPTTMGKRTQEAAFTSIATSMARKVTASRLALRMVRVEIGRGTRLV